MNLHRPSSRPLIKNPVLRDRLNAFVVFTGIAIGGVSGVEMVIGGGFDTITPAFAFEASAPREWYDRPIEPGMGWLSEPYVSVGTVQTVSHEFDGGYPLDTYDTSADAFDASYAGDLEGGPRERAPSHTQAVLRQEGPADDDGALVSAADQPLDEATLDRIVSEADAYVDEINELYAQEHAEEMAQRQVELDEIDPKSFGNGSPL